MIGSDIYALLRMINSEYEITSQLAFVAYSIIAPFICSDPQKAADFVMVPDLFIAWELGLLFKERDVKR